MSHDSIVIYLLLMTMGIFLFIILQTYLVALDMSGWTFLGHVEVAAMMPAVPYLFLMMLLLVPAYFILKGRN